MLTLYLLTFAILAVMLALFSDNNKQKRKIGQLPSPPRLPIIGHLHLLAGYPVPYQAFTRLARKLGTVFGLQLGNVSCAVISGPRDIREALVTKGHHFDSRPDFQRYRKLFCGDKENCKSFFFFKLKLGNVRKMRACHWFKINQWHERTHLTAG